MASTNTRRLRRAIFFILIGLVSPVRAAFFDVDYKSLVSRGDLVYDRPASRSEEGMPVGNGRMGSLVWTTDDAIHFQINRCDVFATDSRTHSFPRAHSEYASGCAYVDIRFDNSSPSVFAPGASFKQHLSVYDALMTAQGAGVTARVLASTSRDVMAIEIDDQRSNPAPIDIDLRMLRYANQYVPGTRNDLAQRHAAVVQTNAHSATMQLGVRDEDDCIVLTQQFREGEYFDASAVAIAVIGRQSKASYYNDSTIRLSAAGGRGKFTILIASSASFDPARDIVQTAIDDLDAAGDEGFDGLLAGNQKWWHNFWAKSFIRLHSADGVADEIEKNYTYFLYVMAASSRGDYPARFGGMLWYTNGDMRAWGSLYWWANQSCYYNGLAPTNRFELLDPTFAMYTRMYDACALAAKQQWGSKGIWIPETTWHNGPEKLPDDIAAEMQDLYLLRKPWDSASARFLDYAKTVQSFSSRWNWLSQGGDWEDGRWVSETKGNPPFGHVTHIFGTTAKVAYLYWQRYEYTNDPKWLRERAYPMLKGTVEFYRNFPNLKKGEDGKYHIHHTNSNEPAWGVRDSDEDLSAIRGVLLPTIRASEILDIDADMRPVWREFLQNLAPIPSSDDPEALKRADYTGPRVWVKGLRPAVKPGGMLPDGNTLPEWNFELCTLEAKDPEILKTANTTLDAFLSRGAGPGSRVGTLSRIPIAAAALGRVDAVKYLIPAQLNASDAARNNSVGIMRNHMALREGPGATECQRLGRVAEALHTALLHSAPPAPGEEPIIRIFPAWPKDWDADYTLLARGAFLVSATIEKGQLLAVGIHSQTGGECRLRNPWPGQTLILHRAGAADDEISGEIAKFQTKPDEDVMIFRKGRVFPAKKIS